MEEYQVMITAERAADIRARYDAVRAFLNGKCSYKPEEVAHLDPPTNDDISALEIFELHRDKPERFTAYVSTNGHRSVTTWTGDRIAVMVDSGRWHTNNMGGRWRQVQIKPDFCRWYYTGREYDSRQCVNFKRMKATF